MERKIKEGTYTDKIKLTVPGNKIKNEMMTTIIEYDGEENRGTEESQPKKCKNPMSTSDTTNVSIYSCTSPARIINNGTKKVTNTETKSVPINNEENKGE